MRHGLLVVLAALALTGLLAASSGAAAVPAPALGSDVAQQYRQAVIAHDAPLAARLRAETRLLATAQPTADHVRLARLLDATRDLLHPWPLAATVARLAGNTGASAPAGALAPAKPYARVRAALDAIPRLERAGRHRAAAAKGLEAYALTAPLRQRLSEGSGGGLDAAFWSTDARHPGVLTAEDRDLPAARVAAAAGRARSELSTTMQVLGDVTVSRATVVSDAAILVFREGLEAVLILAAITASFVGARRALRRPVLLGGLAGIAATALTWGLVQLLISELGTGGLKLEAITGILAIGVLLVVTNWFFHRVYWSQWIARFNRRRKSLERFDRLGFVSGQALGLGVLGLTSVYREGFETVLFLQNLQASAGTQACLLGSGIGLAATLAVGCVTFVAQRKLPYKKMLIATGVLIAVVLAVMTGTTVHVLQGLGWMPVSPTRFTVPIWANSWLGMYATWETLAAQVLALVVVLGSYFVAREIQVRGPQRRAGRTTAVTAG
jgi:high-affinity iron transporter